jgi:LuxR family maltose regulon positive regulatory protein
MGAPVPAAKLSAPALPGCYVGRDRLRATLDGLLTRRVAFVLGGPGWGKTVAVAGWLAGLRVPVHVAWISLEATDGSAPEFYDCLMASLGRQPIAEDRAPGRQLLLEHLRDLLVDKPVIIVLDDLDQIESPAVFEVLEELLEVAPPGVHFVLCGRTEPPLHLARLRVADDLVELRESALRFRPDEVRAFLALEEWRDLDRATLDALVSRTEGWPAGLALAAMTARGAPRPDAVIATFDGTSPAVADYLIGEVLSRLDDETENFVLMTSVLDLLEPAICNEVTGGVGAERILAMLEANHLFVVRLRSGTFRYHQLFRDLLRAELLSRDPALSAVVQGRAAKISERRGEVRSAITHHLAAGNEVRALHLIGTLAWNQHDQGDPHPLREWRRRLLVPAVGRDPWCLLERARIALLAGDVDAASADLDAVERLDGPRSAGGSRPALRGAVHAVRARIHELLGDPEAVLEEAGLARRELGRADARWSPDGLAGAVSLAHLLLGETDRAWKAAEDWPVIAAAPSWMAKVARPSAIAHAAFVHGNPVVAGSRAGAALAASHRLALRTQHPASFGARLAQAGLLAEHNALARAAPALEGLANAAAGSGWRAYSVLARLELARCRAAQLGPHAGLLEVDRARAVGDARPLSRVLGWRIDAAEARIHIDEGTPDTAAVLVANLPAGAVRTILEARLALARGDLKEATALVSRARRSQLSPRTALEVSLVEVRANSIREPSEAAAGLLRLVRDDDTPHLPRVYADEGPVILALLAQLDDPVALALLDEVRGNASVTERLSERELRVLEYLPTRLTNQQIASELYISLNTIKSHIKGIYRKLDVSTRDEAVARAEAAGLLRLQPGSVGRASA